MGFGDNFEPDTGFGKGIHRLTVASVKFIKSGSGKDGIELSYYLNSPDKVTKKWLYESKFFNRFLSGWITQLGLDPYELQQASREGYFKEWLMDNMPGKHGNFMFAETDKKNERTGKPFLEPKCEAEVNLDEYIASQNNSPRAPSPSMPTAQSEQGGQQFPDDVPW